MSPLQGSGTNLSNPGLRVSLSLALRPGLCYAALTALWHAWLKGFFAIGKQNDVNKKLTEY